MKTIFPSQEKKKVISSPGRLLISKEFFFPRVYIYYHSHWTLWREKSSIVKLPLDGRRRQTVELSSLSSSCFQQAVIDSAQCYNCISDWNKGGNELEHPFGNEEGPQLKTSMQISVNLLWMYKKLSESCVGLIEKLFVLPINCSKSRLCVCRDVPLSQALLADGECMVNIYVRGQGVLWTFFAAVFSKPLLPHMW